MFPPSSKPSLLKVWSMHQQGQFTWKLVRNAHSQVPPRPVNQKLRFNKPLGELVCTCKSEAHKLKPFYFCLSQCSHPAPVSTCLSRAGQLDLDTECKFSLLSHSPWLPSPSRDFQSIPHLPLSGPVLQPHPFLKLVPEQVSSPHLRIFAVIFFSFSIRNHLPGGFTPKL